MDPGSQTTREPVVEEKFGKCVSRMVKTDVYECVNPGVYVVSLHINHMLWRSSVQHQSV